MDTELLDYPLPPEAIAQVPAANRDDARMLCVRRRSGTVEHLTVRDLPQLLTRPTAIFRNNVAVLRARLRGVRPTGGAIECLLLRPGPEVNQWWCLGRPGRHLGVGARFILAGSCPAEVLEVSHDGVRLVAFHPSAHPSVEALAADVGLPPLPPYITRQPDDARSPMDTVRYETVYADPRERRAVAAPTAGLHFTPQLIEKLEDRNHSFHDLTLHVGPGTFRPVKTADVRDHPMHGETYTISPKTRQALKAEPSRLAIGTTALRAIEDWWQHGAPDPEGPYAAEATIFILPPARFHVDALLTNFHLPKSTLLCLVSAFLCPDSTEGLAWLKALYREALQRGYRFYSYGDAMLILDE